MAKTIWYDQDGNKCQVQRVKSDGSFDAHIFVKDKTKTRIHFGGNSKGEITFWALTDQQTNEKVGGDKIFSRTFKNDTIANAVMIVSKLGSGDYFSPRELAMNAFQAQSDDPEVVSIMLEMWDRNASASVVFAKELARKGLTFADSLALDQKPQPSPTLTREQTIENFRLLTSDSDELRILTLMLDEGMTHDLPAARKVNAIETAMRQNVGYKSDIEQSIEKFDRWSRLLQQAEKPVSIQSFDKCRRMERIMGRVISKVSDFSLYWDHAVSDAADEAAGVNPDFYNPTSSSGCLWLTVLLSTGVLASASFSIHGLFVISTLIFNQL